MLQKSTLLDVCVVKKKKKKEQNNDDVFNLASSQQTG